MHSCRPTSRDIGHSAFRLRRDRLRIFQMWRDRCVMRLARAERQDVAPGCLRGTVQSWMPLQQSGRCAESMASSGHCAQYSCSSMKNAAPTGEGFFSM